MAPFTVLISYSPGVRISNIMLPLVIRSETFTPCFCFKISTALFNIQLCKNIITIIREYVSTSHVGFKVS